MPLNCKSDELLARIFHGKCARRAETADSCEKHTAEPVQFGTPPTFEVAVNRVVSQALAFNVTA
jgi:hypothetical protein